MKESTISVEYLGHIIIIGYGGALIGFLLYGLPGMFLISTVIILIESIFILYDYCHDLCQLIRERYI